MIVRILFQLFLFLLPFILFLGYRRLVAQDKEHETPYTILFATGLILTSLGLVIWVFFDGSEAGSTYEPARYEDGRIIPGKMVPPVKDAE